MHINLLDGRYQILKILNDGEKAKTYLVEDANLPSSQFIVKQLCSPSSNPQALNILRRLFTSKAATLEN